MYVYLLEYFSKPWAVYVSILYFYVGLDTQGRKYRREGAGGATDSEGNLRQLMQALAKDNDVPSRYLKENLPPIRQRAFRNTRFNCTP